MKKHWPNAKGNNYYFYRVTGAGATWCQSYHFCKERGSQLAVITDKSEWESIMHDQSVIDLVWISARRKDFGAGWTWINDSLSDCTKECKDLSTGNNVLEMCVKMIKILYVICVVFIQYFVHMVIYSAFTSCTF